MIVFEFDMFIPSRDEYAFRVNHPVHMDFMIDGVMIGSSTNTGSLTRSNSGTSISK